MTTQTEAQRLADELEVTNGLFMKSEAAALLRRQDELLVQALKALELSRPAPCGQSDDLMEQERAAHRSIIIEIRAHREAK